MNLVADALLTALAVVQLVAAAGCLGLLGGQRVQRLTGMLFAGSAGLLVAALVASSAARHGLATAGCALALAAPLLHGLRAGRVHPRHHAVRAVLVLGVLTTAWLAA